jgi:hypothetical protein
MVRPKTIYKRKARSFINFISSNIFLNSIKGLKDRTLLFDFNYDNEIIRLKVSIQYFPIVEGIFHNGFDINGSSCDEDINMNICIYSHNFKNTSYNQYNAEIREFLRHEIEHLAQYHYVSKKPTIYGFSKAEGTLEDYLTQKYEIDAFLYGLNYKRKYLKTDIISEIDYTLKHYYSLDVDLFDTVKEVWIKRLKEILPHTI